MTQSNLHYFRSNWISHNDRVLTADLCVYGGTAAGVIAAITAAKASRRVILLNPARHLGGMTTSGLSYTDVGNAAVIGGLARAFYQQMGTYYNTTEEWKFEPHVAENVLRQWIGDHGIEVHHCQFLENVLLTDQRICELRTLGGMIVRAKYFIDCTYEGDLMKAARVSWTAGREPNSAYHETHNGQQVLQGHQFLSPVSPWSVENDPNSPPLPGIVPDDNTIDGRGDSLIQAYNFRVIFTTNPDIRVPFPKPEGYNPHDYQLATRWLNTNPQGFFGKFDPIRGDKCDVNNRGAVSTDFIGGNYAWPDGDYLTREKIFAAHVRYQQGLHWFLANEPQVPSPIRTEYARWGLAADEFTDTSHWPPQLYVREARRMVSDLVINENHCMGRATVDDPVAMGAYTMDSHNCKRFIRDGRVLNEGNVEIKLPAPYGISYRAIVPRKSQCPNLLVPVCLSASHIAFGSIRMEPVFMILAQSAAVAATIALDENIPVQSVPYNALAAELDKQGQILATTATNAGVRGNP